MILARVKDGALSIVSATEWCRVLAPFEGKEVELTVREKEPAKAPAKAHEFKPCQPTLKSERQAAKLGKFPETCCWRSPGGVYRCGKPRTDHEAPSSDSVSCAVRGERRGA